MDEELKGEKEELEKEGQTKENSEVFEKDSDKTEEQENEQKKDTVELEEEVIKDIMVEKIDNLERKLEEIESEKDSVYKKAQRLKADFVNFRKRTAREKMAIGIKAKIELLSEILPIVDSFERALDVKTEDQEFKKGVEMIYKQFVNTLKQEGLTKIEAKGEEFDPEYHEAVCQVEDSDLESGIIAEEIEKGYKFEDRVVRPAKVKVAK